MDPVELLLRGIAALGAMGVLMMAARVRFRTKKDDAGPADIGLD